MALEFPIDCITPAERTEYCYRVQELLRLDRNIKSKDFRDDKISKSEWEVYVTDTFDPKQEQVVEAILEQRKELKKSIKWNIDIGTI